MDFDRWQKKNLEEALDTWRVVLLTGPRQCGKTTLARTLVSKSVEYRTLDDLTLRQAAAADPLGFVQKSRMTKTLIIDEVQKVPELLSAVKQVVDQDNDPAQFLLSGSAQIQSLPTVSESLAGRAVRVPLRPLTQGEIRGGNPRFLSRAFEGEFLVPDKNFTREDLIECAFIGGFPEPLRIPRNKRGAWHRNYIAALIERDLMDVANIKKTDHLLELIEVMASWSSKYVNLTSIGTNLALNRKTLESYLAALKAMFLVETVPPWTKTDYGRVGKQKKSFMTDTGLMTSMLSWQQEELWLDADKMGKLVESFVFQELASIAESSDEEFRIFHFRDREGREIDFLIENEQKWQLGIEVKASLSVQVEDAKHLKWFRQKIAKGPFKGIILYSGNKVMSFGDDIWAVPITALWAG